MTHVVNEISEATRKHPFATLQGINLFARFLAASELWRKATKVQQRLMADASRPLLREAQRQLLVLPRPKEITLGTLPLIKAAPRTLSSMQSKGLVDADGRMTLEAFDAAMLVGDVV